MSELSHTLLSLLPKNTLSRAVGAACRLPGPPPLVRFAIRRFVKAYGVDASESERPVEEYPTFTEFFTRRLKPGLRPIAPGDSIPVSPVDGAVGQCGVIEQGKLVQAKGRDYTLPELLSGPDAGEQAARFEGGTYVTIYLAPYNYHRIHSPLAEISPAIPRCPGTYGRSTPRACATSTSSSASTSASPPLSKPRAAPAAWSRSAPPTWAASAPSTPTW